MQKLIEESQVPAIQEIINEYKVPKSLMTQALGVSLTTLRRNVKDLRRKKRIDGITDAQVSAAHKIHTEYKVPLLTLAALLDMADTPLRNRIIKVGLPLLDFRDVQRAMDHDAVSDEEFRLAKHMYEFGLSWNQIARLSGRNSGVYYSRYQGGK